jgi:acetate kinase
MKIAVINSGSSSLKFKLFYMPDERVLIEKEIEHIGEKGSAISNHTAAIEALDIDFSEIDAIGHRVVHGGEKFINATIIDDEVMQDIEDLIPLAPLHNPANLEGIRVAKQKAPNILQIAVFDTAFHATLDKEAFLYALPYELYENNQVRRYGFHGTSHAYLLKKAASRLKKCVDEVNIITLHLGNGASVCAIKNGKSIDTSMGFTPLEGLIMGTRCGDIDPAIVLYLQEHLQLNATQVDTILNRKSGLLGICGDNDVRNILNATDEHSKLAINMMVRRIQKYIGSYMVLLEDVDAIVFSGGIGENSQEIRERVMNNKIFKDIKFLTIKTDEELEIAKDCLKILKK